jgi:formate dehydrogenase iron-sulfur subunit
LELPLLSRVQEDGQVFRLTTATTVAAPTALDTTVGAYCGSSGAGSVPYPPAAGEQYRFHFDMTKCIGCKCCVVACNEQNGNPADILWRRVGEIEGGVYPDTRRNYLSIGCNHCLEPTCMTGCPVDAYTKDPLTGIVRHSADACIGCQYCTWNCSYGVPQFNPERGVVGKCDMCYGRLSRGQEPACAVACPQQAIQIEVVNIAAWRTGYQAHANSPGMPSADDSLSTTRITLPSKMPADVRKVDLSQLNPADAHWPLIVMTVLTQLSVGAFTSIWLLRDFGAQSHRIAALVALAFAMLALTASTLHLGRPAYAMRALKMWRRSWLSREVLLFTLFAIAGMAYSTALCFDARHSGWLGAVTSILGICGVGASAKLYLVPGRPAWNSPFTIAEFFGTTILLGACAADLLTGAAVNARYSVAIAAVLSCVVLACKLVRLRRSHKHELHGSWQLIAGAFSNHLLARVALTCIGVALLARADEFWARIAIASVLIASEALGRYLFFVTVVPSNIASGYLAQEAA